MLSFLKLPEQATKVQLETKGNNDKSSQKEDVSGKCLVAGAHENIFSWAPSSDLRTRKVAFCIRSLPEQAFTPRAGVTGGPPTRKEGSSGPRRQEGARGIPLPSLWPPAPAITYFWASSSDPRVRLGAFRNHLLSKEVGN